MLGLEDTGSRMCRIGKGELSYGEELTVDEVLARFDAVTRTAGGGGRPARRPKCLAVVGPFSDGLRPAARLR